MGATGSTRRRRAGVGAAIQVSVLFVAYAVLPFRGDLWWVGALLGTALLVGIVPLTVRRVRAVLVSERPVVEAAEALVVLLTMLLVGFAALYYAMDRIDGEFSGIDTRLDSRYFTVTTLATVGYGDITAVGQKARAAVTVQMLFDLAYVGIAARVLLTAARSRSDPAQPASGR
jgi:voltage-gated potassium channel